MGRADAGWGVGRDGLLVGESSSGGCFTGLLLFHQGTTLTDRCALLTQATFPLDVLKTRIQSVQPDVSGKVPDRISVLTAARRAVRADGVRVFWAGLAPTLIRSVDDGLLVSTGFDSGENFAH